METANQFVASTLEKDTGQKPEVACPASVKIEKGGTFECTAKFGPKVEAKVAIQQDDAQGNVTIKSISGILVSRRLEQEIAETAGKQTNTHLDVTCGDRVRAAVPDTTFQCDVKDASGQTAKVNVKVKDATGNVSWEIVKG